MAAVAATANAAEQGPFALVAMEQEAFVSVEMSENFPPVSGITSTWLETYYSEPLRKFKGRPYKFEQTKIEVNCATRDSRRLYSYLFKEVGEPLGELPFTERWRPTPPSSFMGDVVRIVCKGIDETDVIYHERSEGMLLFKQMLAGEFELKD